MNCYEGIVEQVIYRNSDNDYTVISLRTDDFCRLTSRACNFIFLGSVLFKERSPNLFPVGVRLG